MIDMRFVKREVPDEYEGLMNVIKVLQYRYMQDTTIKSDGAIVCGWSDWIDVPTVIEE